MTEHPLHELAMGARYDLTAAQGKLTELLRQIGELDLPEPTERTSFMNGPVTANQCPECGVSEPLHAADCPALAYKFERTPVGEIEATGVSQGFVHAATKPGQEPT